MSDSLVKKLDKPIQQSNSIPGWRVVSGNPVMTSSFQYKGDGGRIISGTWESTVGSYHTTYADPKMHEFVHVIEGRLIITPEGGKPITLLPGDAFVVEPGFVGTWEVVEPVRKRFVLSS